MVVRVSSLELRDGNKGVFNKELGNFYRMSEVGTG